MFLLLSCLSRRELHFSHPWKHCICLWKEWDLPSTWLFSQVSRCQCLRTDNSVEAKWVWLPKHFNHRCMQFYELHNFPIPQERWCRPRGKLGRLAWWLLLCYTQSWCRIVGFSLLPGFPEVGEMFSDPGEVLWGIPPWSIFQKLSVTPVFLCVLSFRTG